MVLNLTMWEITVEIVARTTIPAVSEKKGGGIIAIRLILAIYIGFMFYDKKVRFQKFHACLTMSRNSGDL